MTLEGFNLVQAAQLLDPEAQVLSTEAQVLPMTRLVCNLRWNQKKKGFADCFFCLKWDLPAIWILTPLTV